MEIFENCPRGKKKVRKNKQECQKLRTSLRRAFHVVEFAINPEALKQSHEFGRLLQQIASSP